MRLHEEVIPTTDQEEAERKIPTTKALFSHYKKRRKRKASKDQESE